MKKYIGIDVSKSSIDIYDGKKSYKFDNNELGFKSVVSKVFNSQNKDSKIK